MKATKTIADRIIAGELTGTNRPQPTSVKREVGENGRSGKIFTFTFEDGSSLLAKMTDKLTDELVAAMPKYVIPEHERETLTALETVLKQFVKLGIPPQAALLRVTNAYDMYSEDFSALTQKQTREMSEQEYYENGLYSDYFYEANPVLVNPVNPESVSVGQ